MTIGELIEKYCFQHGITNQRFAERCGVSKGYISQLINGKNPKTGKPITPTIETYIKMADAMNISIDELFRQVDDVLHLSWRHIKFFCKPFKCNAVDQSPFKNLSVTFTMNPL